MWKCSEAAAERSDYLTEQVRLYAMTGQSKYMDAYFEEAETKQRESSGYFEKIF